MQFVPLKKLNHAFLLLDRAAEDYSLRAVGRYVHRGGAIRQTARGGLLASELEDETKGPVSTRDLLASERTFLRAMQQLGYGRFEFVRIERGELVLDPRPTTIGTVRFDSDEPVKARTVPDEFELKRQVGKFFQYVRAVEAGEIRRLEVRHGLPFSMEVEQRYGGGGGGPVLESTLETVQV